MRFAPVAGALLALGVGLMTIAHRTHWEIGLWNRVDYAFVDLWTQLRPADAQAEDIVIIAIDDATLASHPEVLETRAGQARLVEALVGASVVGIDLFFAEAEQLLPADLTADLRTWHEAPEPDTPPRARALLQRTLALTTGDARLTEALEPLPAVLALHFGTRGTTPVSDRSLTRGTFAQVVPGEHLPPASPMVLASLPRFNRAAERLGLISFSEDQGAARRIPLTRRSEGRYFAPFAVQVVALHRGIRRGKLAYLGNEGVIALGDQRIPGDHGQLWVHWNPPGTFETLSAADVIEDPPDLTGKIALVGMTQLGHDEVLGAFTRVPGVEMHANVVENLIADRWLSRAPAWVDAVFAGLAGLLVSLAFAVPAVRTPGRLGAIALGAGIAMGVPAVARLYDVWLGSAGALLAVGVSGGVAVSVAWLQEGLQARRLRRTFAHYVSDELIEVMARDPGMVALRGQRRELSVLFSDIRDFTSFSEQIPPLDLVGFLNTYLTPMTAAVLTNRGFVDKFIGDAVMALFGAPVPFDDHAEHAARAALDMYRALDEVRPVAERYGIDLAIGVGINSGEVAVGNMGSDVRFEYTVLGDAVNLASRLEGLTKEYGVFCLLGPATAAALGDPFSVRVLDLVRVKGKAEPVEVFELLGDGRTEVATYVGLQRWDDAIGAWRRGDLEAARAAFGDFAEHNPQDRAAALYLERLEALDAVPDDWDGVFTHTRK